MMFATIIFATLIFLMERGIWDQDKGCYVRAGDQFSRYGSLDGECSPFESVPLAAWWAITTMTTVGYGDTFPITTSGRVIGAITMVIGILCIALPTTVLGVQFSEHFAEVTEEMAVRDVKNKIPDKEHLQDELRKEMDSIDELQQKIKDLLPQIE